MSQHSIVEPQDALVSVDLICLTGEECAAIVGGWGWWGVPATYVTFAENEVEPVVPPDPPIATTSTSTTT